MSTSTKETCEAQEAWKKFHKRPQIDWEKTVKAVDLWPDKWELAGRAVTTYYASDKWQKDRTFFERYYHDHDKETKIWVPAGEFDWTTTEQPPKSCLVRPASAAVLGLYLGTDVLKPGQDPKSKPGKTVGETGALLLCHPNRRCLYVLEGEPPRGRITGLIWGPKLIVEARGIVG